MPTSIPTAQPQPTTSPFPLSALNLFWPGSATSPLFSNDPAGRSAALATGFTAPPYDPTIPSKCWTDTSSGVATNGRTYGYYDSDGAWQTFTIPAAQSGLNIWGPTEYTAYVPEPTPATRAGALADPTLYSTSEQAESLLWAWKAAYPQFGITLTIDALSTDVLNGETREPWALSVTGTGMLASGSLYGVGEQIAAENANGVGAPGHWGISSAGQPVWVSDIPALPATPMPAGPIPQRTLLPNEAFVPNIMGGGITEVQIVGSGQQTGGNPPAGNAFTASQAASLANCERLLIAIGGRFGVE